MNIYLIRHGESVANMSHDIIGQDPNEPLSSQGELQAQKLGKYFANNNIIFDKVYCSPYKRAHDTCNIFKQYNSYFEEIIVPELREYSAGDMKGQKRTDVMTPQTIKSMEILGMQFKFPNGESLFEVQQRVITWFNSISHSYNNIALFSHGMTIKSFLQFFMQFDHKLTWRISIDNTSISILNKTNNYFVKCINSTSHLEHK